MTGELKKIDPHTEKYEEYDVVPQWLGWVLLVGLTFFILAWGMLLMMLVADTPRQWDFATLPDTPAESVYSTQQPWSDTVGRQIARLPEAKPQEALRP